MRKSYLENRLTDCPQKEMLSYIIRGDFSMTEEMFLVIRTMTTREDLEPYLQYNNLEVREYAKERLREITEDIFSLEDI